MCVEKENISSFPIEYFILAIIVCFNISFVLFACICNACRDTFRYQGHWCDDVLEQCRVPLNSVFMISEPAQRVSFCGFKGPSTTSSSVVRMYCLHCFQACSFSIERPTAIGNFKRITAYIPTCFSWVCV